MRIAFFTLLSPIQSAVADYGEGLAQGLARVPGVTVDLFVDGTYQPDNAAIIEQFKIYPYTQFKPGEYDVCLYSVGDHPYHEYMLGLIHRHPGVVVLHDLTLHNCILQTTLGRGNTQAYLDEIRYAYGLQDWRPARQIQAGLGDSIVLRYPLFERIVDDSRAVIVQNDYARRRVLAKCPRARVRRIPYPFFLPPGAPQDDWPRQRTQQRRALGLNDQLVLGSFGLFVPNKHLEASLRAFAAIMPKSPQSKYILGGPAVGGYDLEKRIREMGLTEQVTLTGWLPPAQFAQMMFALDIGIHLRYPHIGGTPYTPIRLMGLGVCTVVSDIEPLAEIPQGACIKIAPDDYQEETLAAMVDYIASHADFRRQVAANGQQYVREQHDLDRIAREYVVLMQEVAQ